MAENVKAISEKYKPNFDHYVDYAFKYLPSLIRVIFDMNATLNKSMGPIYDVKAWSHVPHGVDQKCFVSWPDLIQND